MKTLLFFFATFFSSLLLFGQDLSQTVRGTVIDKQSQFPIPGAKVTILGTNPIRRTVTDTEGNFAINEVPLGRLSVEISYSGFETITLQNLELKSGKELIVNARLEEKITNIQEVQVTQKDDKGETINKMASVSARTISVEEAGKFAGTLNDPARMAQNYAGVSGVSDSRNDIIIRGNSPLGVLWRVEGIDIPSPNHFASLGTTGGPVSMLNINNLANSDFYTSAWTADYGNATSGVFDLRLRNGNNQKHEHLAQVGFNGFELGAEGPFSKKKRGSYLINYRYSTLGVISALGINLGVGAAVPQYQDLTFKLNLPTEKAGKFTVWGIGGISHIQFDATGEVDSTNLYSNPYEDTKFGSNTAVIGASHKYFFGTKTFSELIVASSFSGTVGAIDSITPLNEKFNTTRFNRKQLKTSGNFKVNHKFNAKNTLTVAVIAEHYGIDMIDSSYVYGQYRVFSNYVGGAVLLQSYASYQHKFNDKLTFNGGLHSQHFLLSQSNTVEPRIGFRFKVNNRNTIGFGSGIHSQLQPISVYFIERKVDGVSTYPNQNLDFTKAVHNVLSYDLQVNENSRIKTEFYYQYLYNVPVDTASNGFSMINQGADFILPNGYGYKNAGTGTNYGMELTFERFLKKGFYYLFTASVFESKYKGSDGIEHNTAYNGNYIFNALGGKEFKILKRWTLGFDIRSTYAGGRRYTPINLEASILEGRQVNDENQLFEKQHPNYFRFDFKTTVKFNGNKMNHEFSVDLQNLTNQQNVFQSGYNRVTQNIGTVYQRGFFPNVQYKLYF
ncbi:MAG: TonB-dependent receptor [Crocinitomicaceae bacterium]